MGTKVNHRKHDHKVKHVYLIMADFDESSYVKAVYASETVAKSVCELLNKQVESLKGLTHHWVKAMGILQ